MSTSELEQYCEFIAALKLLTTNEWQLNDLELTRLGYRLKKMGERFDSRPAEIRAFFSSQLGPVRALELRDRLLAIGLPI